MTIQFQSGDKVRCRYRQPRLIQYWVSPVHVGIARLPKASITSATDRTFNEAQYCQQYNRVPVEYPFGLMYENAADLKLSDIPATCYLTWGEIDTAKQVLAMFPDYDN